MPKKSDNGPNIRYAGTITRPETLICLFSTMMAKTKNTACGIKEIAFMMIEKPGSLSSTALDRNDSVNNPITRNNIEIINS